jgi:hypothetical protein
MERTADLTLHTWYSCRGPAVPGSKWLLEEGQYQKSTSNERLLISECRLPVPISTWPSILKVELWSKTPSGHDKRRTSHTRLPVVSPKTNRG